MTSDQPLQDLHPTQKRIHRILDPDHPLCREDVVWMLEYIKKKVADEDPALLDLSQPRLLQNFRFFAEAAMSLIHRRHCSDQEADRLREWLRQATFGLHNVNPREPKP
ncbi:hypothetical protein FHS16_002320 [Paenibacillus endophyticus]|uniref:Uncharacterized protein n=1 Tax=Paenibacillus endophyticus TaxID=1294268 RepID=A0A7W5G9K5_9BACL|nr:hypothetical protein [Paenibacillus endophyticus]MBB3152274.1 hypothetical protein [Paenibacillus endophyticus]